MRTLYHGQFGAGQSVLARDAVCVAADVGARDVLYVVANRTARDAVVTELVARRGALFGLRVVTLRRLPLEIERRARTKGDPIASGVVEDVLLERAVRVGMRATANGAAILGAPITGLATAVSRTIAAVERGGGTRVSLASALATLPTAGDGARVLLDSWATLERLRDRRFRTDADAQRSATALLRSRQPLDGCSLVVLEDLPIYASLERDLIAALLETASCAVVATIECAPQLATSRATRALAALRTLASWDEHECHPRNQASMAIGARLFSTDSGDREASSAPVLRITRLEAAGDVAEVRLAARVVRRYLRGTMKLSADPGEAAPRPPRPSDVLIVARGGRYRELIAELFVESGIPTRVSAGRSAAESGLGSVLLELLDLAGDRDGGTRDQALALVRTPHLDIGMRAADKLERRVLRRGCLGLDGWDALALRTLGERTVNRVNRLKRVVAYASGGFANATCNAEAALVVRRIAKELRLVGNAYFARRRLRGEERGDGLYGSLADVSVREDNQTWEAIEEILDDTMPALLRADGDAHAATTFGERWRMLFERALFAHPGAPMPAGADMVRVAGASAGDGQPARVTIILGLQQKLFPRQPRQDPFLRDTDRRHLTRDGIELETSEDEADCERESFARAVATAGEALYLSYPATDAEGKPAVRSFFIDDLQRAAGGPQEFEVERLGVADIVPHPEDAATRAEMLAAVAHGIWQRLPATPAARAVRAACFAAWDGMAADALAAVPIATGRIAAARPSFDAAVFAHAPHRTLELSASQLGTLHHCTFQHFVEKVLRPSSLAVPEYDSLAKGSLVHDAMMHWATIDGWSRGDAALLELDAWFTRRAAKLSPAAREGALAQFTIDADRTRLTAFVQGELDVVRSVGAAQPTYSELAFGRRIAEHGNRDPASLPSTFDLVANTSLGARTVKFTGSIDRVDVYAAAGVTHGIALDYKTGRTSAFHSGAMMDGADLQLRLYLLALERLWGIMPAGALYVGFGDGVRRGAISEEAATRIGELDTKCITVMPQDEWNSFVHVGTEQLIQQLIERLVTLDIVAQPFKGDCGFCELEPVCRYSKYDLRAASV